MNRSGNSWPLSPKPRPGSLISPASVPSPRRRSWPRPAWTCPGSRPPVTCLPGQSYPRVKSSAGKEKCTGSTGHGNRYLARALGEAAVSAGKTNTFLGERYRRLRRRRGKKRAAVAVGRSILVIVWHLLADPEAHFHDLAPDYILRTVNPDTTRRNLIRRLEGLGYNVALTPAA